MTPSCVFCRIIDGHSPARFVHEDTLTVAIQDISPQAPHHYLIIPRKHIATLNELQEEDVHLIGHIHKIAADLASGLGFAEHGFRVVANCNRDGGQTVWHIHFHLLGGRPLSWPPG